MTRSIFFLGAMSVVAFMAGWFTIERDGDRTRIEINRSEIRSDARQALDRGRDYWEQRQQQLASEQGRGLLQNGEGYFPAANNFASGGQYSYQNANPATYQQPVSPWQQPYQTHGQWVPENQQWAGQNQHVVPMQQHQQFGTPHGTWQNGTIAPQQSW